MIEDQDMTPSGDLTTHASDIDKLSFQFSEVLPSAKSGNTLRRPTPIRVGPPNRLPLNVRGCLQCAREREGDRIARHALELH